MGESIISRIGSGLERMFAVDGDIVQRETLMSRDAVAGMREVLELLKTDKGTLYLHSNIQESHTYYRCTEEELRQAAATISQFIETPNS